MPPHVSPAGGLLAATLRSRTGRVALLGAAVGFSAGAFLATRRAPTSRAPARPARSLRLVPLGTAPSDDDIIATPHGCALPFDYD